MKKQVWKETKAFILDILPELFELCVAIAVSAITAVITTWLSVR